MTQFKCGDFSTFPAPCLGRHKTVTTPEITDQIHELILEERRISAKSIAEELGISSERVGSIIHEDLDMRKLSAKRIPKCLNAEQKLQRCHSYEKIWNFFSAIKIISCQARLVRMDETWVYHYDLETKQQSIESCPKKFRVQKSTGKFLASIFWDQDGILLIDNLPNGQIINTEYYSSVLEQMKDILKEKRPRISPRASCSCTTIIKQTSVQCSS